MSLKLRWMDKTKYSMKLYITKDDSQYCEIPYHLHDLFVAQAH